MESGFVNIEKNVFSIPLKMSSASQALELLQEAAGAYRAVISDCPEDVQTAGMERSSRSTKKF